MDFKKSLDSEMKRLQSKGLGISKRQAEPISQMEEEKLWEMGLLGDHSPQALLDTMIFYNGLYFALRSGREHRQLRIRPCQIQLFEREGERAYLQYTEDISKNRPGGIKGRHIKPKVVDHHENIDSPQRCFVRLFKKYVSLCPKSAEVTAFYLQPASKPTDKCWYTSRPLGHNTLTKTISKLCSAAGITGFKTNHSLRATAATRLYESGIDEQLVMERTGHRSLPGVRSYKRTSSHQKEALSDILNKIPKFTNDASSGPSTTGLSTSEPTPSISLPSIASLATKPTTAISNLSTIQSSSKSPAKSMSIPETDTILPTSTFVPNSLTNLTATNIQTKNSVPGTYVFNSCSSITFHIHH